PTPPSTDSGGLSERRSALVGVDLGRHDGCRNNVFPMKKARRNPAGFFISGVRSLSAGKGL
ncbi:hypothetical protein, partial [Stenotrophomonas maltophilia]